VNGTQSIRTAGSSHCAHSTRVVRRGTHNTTGRDELSDGVAAVATRKELDEHSLIPTTREGTGKEEEEHMTQQS